MTPPRSVYPVTRYMAGKLEVGDILSGKYRVDAFIGEGGMGVVARATQIDLGRSVAVKALRPEVQGNAQVVERFDREARAASRIQGPHAVQILDVGRTDTGTPFLVMELLTGEDLDHLVRRKGKLRLEVAAWLMVQACSGVADAHRMRVVHRDLKPSNLFLAQRAGGPVLKVLDFGISRLDEQATDLTRTMTQLGTPHYMSPEQIERPKSVDHRTDIWALGCIFHRLLTGQAAFRGKGAHLVAEVLRGRRQKPSQLVSDLPPAVDAILDRCLAHTPDARYQSADELAAALRELAPSDWTDSEPVTTPLPADEPEADTTVDMAVQVENTLSDALAARAAAPEESRSASRGAVPSLLCAPTQAMGARRTSRAPWSLPLTTRARVGASWGMPAALLVLVAVVCTAVFVAPGLLAKRIAARAARAGLTLMYAEPRATLSGLTLDHLDVSVDAMPNLRMRATKATFSYSMQSLSLEGADAELGASMDDVARAAGPALEGLPSDAPFTIDADDAHIGLDAGGLRVDGNRASVFVDVAAVRYGVRPEDRVRVKMSSPELRAVGLGLDLPGLSAHIDSSAHEGTFAATRTSPSPVTVRGTFDASGFVASARIPGPLVSRSIEARTPSGALSGTIYLSVFAVQ